MARADPLGRREWLLSFRKRDLARRGSPSVGSGALDAGFYDRCEPLSRAAHRDAFDIVVVLGSRHNGIVCVLVPGGLVRGPGAGNGLGRDAREGPFFLLATVDIEGEVLLLASGAPTQGVGAWIWLVLLV